MGYKTNLFLSDQDLESIARWRYKVVDASISTRLLTPFWNWLALFVPTNVAPNVLTLAAFACVLQAFWLVVKFGDEFPRASAAGAAVLTYCYFTLDCLDGKHARNTKNSSPLGELFDHGCDNLGCPFQVITILLVLGVDDLSAQWYLVQITQLLFLAEHIAPYVAADRTIRFGLLSGPGEALHMSIAILLAHAAVGRAFVWDFLIGAYRYIDSEIINLGLPPLPAAGLDDSDVNGVVFLRLILQNLYYVVLAGLVVQVGLMLFMKEEGHRRSGRALLICLATRGIPALFLRYSAAAAAELTLENVITDGLFLSILTSDIIVAKIANRPVHSLVVIMSMASIMSGLIVYLSITVYYLTVFNDICLHLNLPMLSTVKNVYCDGVFDLLHRGHMDQFRQAYHTVDGGVRLFVGVVDDKESTDYLGQAPVMSEEERYASVAACKYVHQVIKGSPLAHSKSTTPGEPSRTERLIEKYNIHYFAIGRDFYELKEGQVDYYEVPRALGILRPTERTGGVETGTLIQRILARRDEFAGRKDVYRDVVRRGSVEFSEITKKEK
jgi:ethanolaminephosphotransferase